MTQPELGGISLAVFLQRLQKELQKQTRGCRLKFRDSARSRSANALSGP